MIPLSTTTVTVNRLQTTDPNSAVDLDSETDLNTVVSTNVVIVTGVRAYFTVDADGTRNFNAAGEQERVVFKFRTDPFDGIIQGDDTLTDADGQIYRVYWARLRSALGITFFEGSCFQEVGVP